jgi:undecaprenyl-diphosphatase
MVAAPDAGNFVIACSQKCHADVIPEWESSNMTNTSQQYLVTDNDTFPHARESGAITGLHSLESTGNQIECYSNITRQRIRLPDHAFYLAQIHALDTLLCLGLNCTSRHRRVRQLFRLVSRLGDGMFWCLLMLGILATERSAAVVPVLHMATAGICGTLVYKAVKGRTLRPRPFEVNQTVIVGMAPLDRFSFPSGHTLHAVLFSVIALAYYPSLIWILLPFTLLVAASRLVLGLHYPSDVLAGAGMGALIASGSLMLA